MRGRLGIAIVVIGLGFGAGFGCSFDPQDLRALRDGGGPAALDGAAVEGVDAVGVVDSARALDATSGLASDGAGQQPDLSLLDVSITVDAPLVVDVSIAADAAVAVDLVRADLPTSADDVAADASMVAVDVPASGDASSEGPLVVDGGVDMETACVPGRRRCQGTTLEVCDETGAWLGTPVTKGVCDALCTPGTFDCEYKTRQVCSAAGTWQDAEECPFVCLSGVCAGECVPGTGQCSGAMPQTCDSQGKWKNGTACKYACVGQGQCGGSCQPGSSEIQCVGTTPQHCNQDGNWVSDPIKKDVCNAECNPKDTLACGNCNGGVQTCNALGMWGPCNNQPGPKVTYYYDGDNDLYGDPKVTTTSCTGAPTGYVTNNLDCCDLDDRAKPGQTVPLGSPNLCGTYDYNCDGQQKPMVYHTCCVCSSSSDVCATANCGAEITVTACKEVTYPSYSCSTTSSKGEAQKCL